MKSLEVQLNEALELITSLKTILHEQQVTIATLERTALLKEANLPQGSIKRLHEAFGKSTNNDGLKQAINIERRNEGKHGKAD